MELNEVGPPVARRAARVVVLAGGDRVLLLRGGDPHRPAHVVWHAPGGGLEAHESWAAAAARELAEETGLVVPEADLGEPIWCRSVLFSFAGTTYAQRERYFLLAVEAPFLPDTAGFTAVERTLLTEHVWWDHDQLRACHDHLAPPDLADRLADLVRDGRPAGCVKVAGGTALDRVLP